MNAPFALPLTEADLALVECARRVQLSLTKHRRATEHYEALCAYVDREGSPLQGLVLGCFGSGSFGTGTAVASSVTKNQHDIDVVIELNISPLADPETVLETLFDAINGDRGSRYFGKVTRNSRCVTVEYDDGVKVDLMPVARLQTIPERASNLFHSKPPENYHKPVNPYDFKELFNGRVAQDRTFFEAFQRQAALAEDSAYVLEKAEAEPFPEIIPLEQKSPLTAAIQLIKRFRDLRYRQRKTKRPPSVVLTAIAVDLQISGLSFVDIIISLAELIRRRIADSDRLHQLLAVHNPAWPRDVFTDRWPDSLDTQRQFGADLRYLRDRLTDLKRVVSDSEIKEILDDLFGESVGTYAIEKRFMVRGRLASSGIGTSGVGTGGALIAGATSPAIARVSTIPKNTSFGGGLLVEID